MQNILLLCVNLDRGRTHRYSCKKVAPRELFHQAADMAIDFVATNVEFGIVGIFCRVICSLDDSDTLFLEGVGAKNNERVIGIEALHKSQGAAIFTPAPRIFDLHENANKLIIASGRVLRRICFADERLEDIHHFGFVTLVEVVFQDVVFIFGQFTESI